MFSPGQNRYELCVCVFSGSEQVRTMCLCFLRVRTVYELCQGELILDVANYDYANVFIIHPIRGMKMLFLTLPVWRGGSRIGKMLIT